MRLHRTVGRRAMKHWFLSCLGKSIKGDSVSGACHLNFRIVGRDWWCGSHARQCLNPVLKLSSTCVWKKALHDAVTKHCKTSDYSLRIVSSGAAIEPIKLSTDNAYISQSTRRSTKFFRRFLDSSADFLTLVTRRCPTTSVAVRTNHGTYVLDHSGDIHFTKIRTGVDDPSTEGITRCIPILNPVTLFIVESNSVNEKKSRSPMSVRNKGAVTAKSST